ncbi:MAG: phospholipase D family protein [Parasphingopyxis sp.]
MAAEPPFLVKGEGSASPFPVREGARVTPLVESAQMYPTLEHAILKSERFVWLAFRVLAPDMKLRSDKVRAQGLKTWRDLLIETVKRGVEVRILLSDFEPVMADYLHAGSWRSFRSMEIALDELPDEVRRRFQMIITPHEGEMGWGWRQIFRLGLLRRVHGVIDRLLGTDDGEEDHFSTRPGIWRWTRWEGERPAGWRKGPPPRIWPATHHQKCAIVDGERIVVGGLDLDERRFDDSHHNRPADQTWHDISSLIEGEIALDACAHFMALWNSELPRYRVILDEWTEGAALKVLAGPLDPLEMPDIAHSICDGAASVQLVRTVSRKSGSLLAIGPRPHIRELMQAHRKLIAGARKRLYIEAQFFRSRAASKWIVAALRDNPQLEVVILIANVPEEIAFQGQGGKAAHKHGEHLQARALGRIFRAGGKDRVGLFTLVKNEPTKGGDKAYEDSRGTAYGSGIIHIHAKLLIADDEACLLSSANINGRSFFWDTELGFLWRQPGNAIRDFRRRIWSQLFEGALPEDGGLAEWRQLSEQNRLADPEDRKGFVVPYQRGRARRFGNPYIWIPDNMV